MQPSQLAEGRSHAGAFDREGVTVADSACESSKCERQDCRRRKSRRSLLSLRCEAPNTSVQLRTYLRCG